MAIIMVIVVVIAVAGVFKEQLERVIKERDFMFNSLLYHVHGIIILVGTIGTNFLF